MQRDDALDAAPSAEGPGAAPIRPQDLAALLFLLLAGCAAIWYSQRVPALEVDASPLHAVAERFGQWQSVDIPIDDDVAEVLNADFNLQRAYRTRLGDLVWLYVGYYGTDVGGRPAHTPRGCYPAAGWAIHESQVLRARKGEAPVNEYLIEREGEWRLVHFWYRSHRGQRLLGGLDQNVDRMLGRLLDGRADGALIRLSTPVREAGVDAARLRLLSLGEEVDGAVAGNWPIEQVASR